tara:strand:- start:184 stop:1467 length:1284 start_codon:yes stop_codon:yes gene_type:complete
LALNFSENNDVIVPTVDGTTYRGQNGDDTYILVSQDGDAKVSITDTAGNNTIQLPEWSKIKSLVVAKNAIQITCDNMTIFTINGADKFNYDVGGNKTGNEVGSIKTYEEFVSLFDLSLPNSGTNTKSVSKIVFQDELNQLYEVTVNNEDDGNKYYINGELTPSLNLSSGKKYIFDQNDVTSSKHPISFSITKNGIHADGKSSDNVSFYINGYKTTESKYSENFNDETTFDNGFVVLEPSNTDTELYYFCLFHSGMSKDANILIDGFTPVTTPSIEATLDVSNNGASDYVIKSSNNITYNDPTITLVRGKTYEFEVNSPGHPFWIKTAQSTGSSNVLNSGITNNGTSNGKITFTAPLDGPDTLYYNCQFHASMTGTINLVENDGVEILTTINSGSAGGGYGYSLDLDLAYSTDISNNTNNIIYDSLII